MTRFAHSPSLTRSFSAPADGWRPAGFLGLALVLALSLALSMIVRPAPARAQDTDPHDRLASELDRTDNVIDEARDVVAASESQRARLVLENAVELQSMARDFFSRCDRTNLTACEGAARATTRARRQAFNAIRVAREQSSLEQQAGRTIERVANLLDEAKAQVVGENLSPHTHALIDEAETQLERARERYQARQFAVALELAQSSERLLRQALDLGERGEVNPERVRRELERTDRLIERAKPIIGEGGNPQARRLLDQAMALQTRAYVQLERGRPLVAFRLTRQARELIHRALKLVEGPVNVEAVERAIEQTEHLIERVEPVVRENHDEEAIRLLDAGKEHQQRARDLLADNQLSAALAQTRVARNLVLEASQRVGGEGTGH